MEKWQRVKTKKAHDSGEAYVRRFTGKHVPARNIGPPCQCGCFNNIDRKIIEDIFKNFWALGSYDKEPAYLQSLMESVPVKHRRKELEGDVPRRTQTVLYKIVCSNKDYPVCKAAFRSIFSISDKRVRNVLRKLTSPEYPFPTNVPPCTREKAFRRNSGLCAGTHTVTSKSFIALHSCQVPQQVIPP